MSIPILINPALLLTLLASVFMLSSVASSPPTRQPMIIYNCGTPDARNPLASAQSSKSAVDFRVVCVKFSKKEDQVKRWKRGEAYSQTLRQGEVAAARAPEGQGSGAGAKPL